MTHTLFIPGARAEDVRLLVEGEEAKHAVRVKRLEPGESVRVLNGGGLALSCVVIEARRSLVLEVQGSSQIQRLMPAVHVCAATPKGPRLDKMIDQLSQVGAASWTPIETEWGVVDPGDRKLDRVRRIAAESAKQCARGWLLEINESVAMTDVLSSPSDGGGVMVLAHADAPGYSPCGAREIRLLVGPEGGFSPRELDAARSAGVRLASFGAHVMRVETAAVVACGVILHVERAGFTPRG